MATQRGPRLRSPNYPGVTLGKAVDAVKSLYSQVQRSEFTPTDAASAWGYRGVNGIVRIRMAALKQYGLIEQKRGDNAKLTTQALTLVLRNPASNEYTAVLKQAALEPSLFRELYEESKHTAAADALRQHLVVDRSFTDKGAAQVTEVVRETLELAGLVGVSRQEGGKREAKEEELPQPPSRAGSRSVQIPLPGTTWATLAGPFPVSESVWQQMMAMLNAMKPGLVVGEEQRATAEEGN